MKTTIIILAVLVLFLLMANVEITRSPFKIILHTWRTALGWVFLSIGVTFMMIDKQRQGYVDGLKDGSNATVEAILKSFKEKDAEQKANSTTGSVEASSTVQ